MRRRRAEVSADAPEASLESTLEGPEVVGLIERFVAELPERAAAIEQRLAADDLDGVARLANRLKGTAAGNGFPSIMAAAASLETSARAGEAVWQVTARARALAVLCGRARAPGGGAQ